MFGSVQQNKNINPVISITKTQSSCWMGNGFIKGGRMGRSDTVSLWCVSLLINTRFRFFILE